MYKKYIIIIVLCFTAFVVLIIKLHLVDMIFAYSPTSDKPTIENLIMKAIKIQYRGGNEAELNSTFTNDFIKEINENPHFFKKRFFYTYNKDFMRTLRELDNNTLTVSVKTEDLFGSYIQIVTLIKTDNDNYLISNIQFDI
jgi:hypothetical protein